LVFNYFLHFSSLFFTHFVKFTFFYLFIYIYISLTTMRKWLASRLGSLTPATHGRADR